MTAELTLYAEVPICAFRPYESREYQDTFPVPPPSSVYGMLLSLTGVERGKKDQHRGVEMCLAFSELPQRSRVFRKLRRGKDLENIRPDYQDLLVDLQLWIWLRPGEDAGAPSLCENITTALREPARISRQGGLSLGESSYLVNGLSLQAPPRTPLIFLKPSPSGFYNFPIWVDHQNANQTRTGRFDLTEPELPETLLPESWIRIS